MNWITETFSIPLSNHDLFKAPDYFSTTAWVTGTVDQKVSDIQRQYEQNLASEYTENLLERDLATVAKYQLHLASWIIDPSWTGPAQLISDITRDFGSDDLRQIASVAGDCLSAYSIAFGHPFAKFTTVSSRFLDWSAAKDINQPLQTGDIIHPLDFNDGFTSLSGWSKVNITFTPSEIDYHPFSYPSSWEGTWTRQIQNRYTVSTGLNSNLNSPTISWSTYNGISTNLMLP